MDLNLRSHPIVKLKIFPINLDLYASIYGSCISIWLFGKDSMAILTQSKGRLFSRMEFRFNIVCFFNRIEFQHHIVWFLSGSECQLNIVLFFSRCQFNPNVRSLHLVFFTKSDLKKIQLLFKFLPLTHLLYCSTKSHILFVFSCFNSGFDAFTSSICLKKTLFWSKIIKSQFHCNSFHS